MSHFFDSLRFTKLLLIFALASFQFESFGQDGEVGEPSAHLPAVIVNSVNLSPIQVLDEINSALAVSREANKRSESHKNRLIQSLNTLIASNHLFSDFHLRLLGSALEELNRKISTSEAQEDLGKAIVSQMKLVINNAVTQGLIFNGLSSQEDLKLIDALSANPGLFQDYLELLDDSYPQFILNTRRLLVSTGQVNEDKFEFSGQELINFSKLPISTLNSMLRDYLNNERVVSSLEVAALTPSPERNYVEIIPSEVGIGVFYVSIIGGILGGIVTLTESSLHGDPTAFTSVLLGAPGSALWAYGAAEDSITNHQAKLTQSIGKVGMFAAVASPLLVGSELPFYGYVGAGLEAGLAGALLSLPVIYTRDIMSKLGSTSRFFPGVKKSLMKLWSGGKYRKLTKELKKNSKANLTHLISSDGEMTNIQSVDDYLRKAEMQESLVEPQHSSISEKLRSEINMGGVTFDSFNEVQRALVSYMHNEGKYQVMVSSSLSQVLSEVLQAYYRWKAEPTDLHGDILIDKVLGSNQHFERILGSLENALRRSALTNSRTKDYYEKIVKDINSGVSPESDRESLMAGARALSEIERFGSLNMQYLTYKLILEEIRTLMTKTFLSLSEPLTLSQVNQATSIVSLENIEAEAKSNVLSNWQSIAMASLFQSLDPKNLLTGVFARVEEKLLEREKNTQPLVIDTAVLSCSGILKSSY